MKSKIIRGTKYLIFFILGVLLLYLAFKEVNVERMVNALKSADYSWVILTMFLGLLTFISRGVRWLILLDSMGYKAKTSNSIYSVIIGYLANLALPRVGEVTRCTALNQVERIPVGRLFGTILVERAIDMVILLFILFMTILSNLETFGGFFYDIFGAKAARSSGVIGILLLLFLVGIVALYIIYRYRRKLMRIKLFFKIFSLYRGIGDGFKTVFKMKKKLPFLLHTLFIWVLYYLMTYLCFFSFDATKDMPPSDGLFIMAAGGMGMIAPTQGGMGSYHWMVMKGFGVLGLTDDMGFTVGFVIHTSQVLTIIITGGLSLIMWGLARQKIQKASKNEKEPAVGPK